MATDEKGKGLRTKLTVERVGKDNLINSGLKQQIEKTRSGRRKSYTMDLRIHSPASLGYFKVKELDTAPALVRLAKVKGLDVIAITDFFSAAFVDKTIEAAKGSSITVIPGVNLRCQIDACSDVILTCIFPENTNASHIEDFLKSLDIPDNACDNKNYVLSKPFAEVLEQIEKFGGVAFPSRMDKTPQQIHVLPALVERYGFRAFDLAYPESINLFKRRWPKIKFHFFSFSNARALAQIGSRMAKVKMLAPGFQGIKELVMRESI
ncbi:MAG: hypothetical protein GYA55_00550 [SAR324 cluster bacterium]|uniref:Polymerase/histidinol phosphatase N-terminal domain-containing protein n=1 Tax=SAR324 cluster bacterium TaxID=2024889 RepID=A0A7X9IJ33_9DELT|nr:hypothetical protein [SAR324 cluster bacterium]